MTKEQFEAFPRKRTPPPSPWAKPAEAWVVGPPGAGIDRGTVVRGLVLADATILGLTTQGGPPDDERPRVEDCSFTHVRVVDCQLNSIVFRNVRVDGIRLDEWSQFLRGCEFHNVTLTGQIGYIDLQPEPFGSDDHVNHGLYPAYLAGVESRSSDLSLDISEAIGDIAFRGIGVRRVKRDPETQAIVTRAHALRGAWNTVDISMTTWSAAYHELANGVCRESIIMADRSKRSFAQQVQAIAELRRVGAAEPD